MIHQLKKLPVLLLKKYGIYFRKKMKKG